MNEVNFQASVNNTVQMDRHQQDTARTPVVNQSQNAVIEQEEAEKRIQMPVQPDQVKEKRWILGNERPTRMRRKSVRRKTAEIRPAGGEEPQQAASLLISRHRTSESER